MKKTIRVIIYTFIISIFGIINVNAASLSFDGDKTITGGSSGSNDIKITAAESEGITKVEFTISTSDASLVTLSLNKSSTILGEVSGTRATLFVNEGYFTNLTIAKLQITNNNLINNTTNSKIVISDIKFTDKDNNVKIGANHEKTITLTPGTTARPKSSNSKLTGLSVSSGTLTPSFNSSGNSYKVFNLRDTIKTVTITTKCDMCNVQIKCETGCTNYNNQNRPELEIGKNVLNISTISEDGSSNSSYELIIYRGVTTDNSSFLASIDIDGFKLTEKFDKENLDYTLKVPNDTTSLDIIATPEDELAKVEIKGADNLIVGENVITITITSSETNDKKIYNITVTRLDEDEVMTTSPVEQPVEKKKSKFLLIVIIVVIALAIIGVAAYFIFWKKKKKDKPEVITDEGKIEQEKTLTEIEVKENDLISDLNMTDKKVKPTVDEALADLMTTKEIILQEE